MTAEFVYNADGLRVQKTVNGVVTKYTLHGKNVVHMTSGTDELHFFYDAQNRPAVVVYNGVPYAYVKSLQGDIVAILDENGNTVVSYGYDAWGAPLWCTGELAETLGKVQPFRYRGYVFDEETGLYYICNRYYNSTTSRFLTADNSCILTETNHSLYEKNLYAYCDNNPVSRDDQGGDIWGWLVGATVGAVSGVIGQIVSDVVTSVLSQEVKISDWQTYVGAAIGGAAGGVVLATTGNTNAANCVSAAVTTGVGMTLEKVTGEKDYSWGEIVENTCKDAIVAGRFNQLEGIKGITAGKNSYWAVFRAGLTKLRTGSAVNMSKKVFRKGIVSSIVGGYAMDFYYGMKQYCNNEKNEGDDEWYRYEQL